MGRMEERQAGSGRATMSRLSLQFVQEKEATDQILMIARKDGRSGFPLLIQLDA